jgi:hypothetical protein
MMPLLNKILNYPVVRLKLADGLGGVAALTDSAGRVFSKDDWLTCLAEPDELGRNPVEVLKQEGDNSVIVKTLKLGNSELNAVVKTRLNRDCHIRYPRALKSLETFRRAVFLKRAGIPAEIPLAALWKQQNIFTAKNVFITEYVPQSSNLYHFVQKDLPVMQNQTLIKRQLAHQLASILAAIHNYGMWHRDAKPSNFLVRKDEDNQFNVMLVDIDGIKPYCGLKTFGRRFRAFAHLAVLRPLLPLVYMTDCLRTFSIYCNLTGLDKAVRKQLFRRLVNGLAAKRIERLALTRKA